MSQKLLDGFDPAERFLLAQILDDGKATGELSLGDYDGVLEDNRYLLSEQGMAEIVDTLGGSLLQFTQKGQRMLNAAAQWVNGPGQMGSAQLIILNKLSEVRSLRDDAIRQLITELEGKIDKQIIEFALLELDRLGIVKAQRAWGSSIPIRVDLPRGSIEWYNIIQSDTPPAWWEASGQVSLNVGSQNIQNIKFSGNNNSVTQSGVINNFGSSEIFSAEQARKIESLFESMSTQISEFITDFDQRAALQEIVTDCEQQIKQAETQAAAAEKANSFFERMKEQLKQDGPSEAANIIFLLIRQLLQMIVS